MHTMARVKNAARGEDQLIEPDDRERGEAAIVAAADALTANTIRRASRAQTALRCPFRADRDRAARSRPAHVPPVRPAEIPGPVRRGPGRAGDLVRGPDPAAQGTGHADPRRGRARPPRQQPSRTAPVDHHRQPERAGLGLVPDPAPLAAELGVSELVDFRPHSMRTELFRWYCVSDVVGVPSYTESFGLVALEAQACGRPVVATDVGGLRQTVVDRQTGLLVNGDQPGRWADALAAVLDGDEDRVRMGRTPPPTPRPSAGTTPPPRPCRRTRARSTHTAPPEPSPMRALRATDG